MLNSKVTVTRYGGPEVLLVVQEPLREAQPGEVLVKVRTAGVALADIMRREGLYPHSPVPPFTPGYDAIGVVAGVGADVQGFATGEDVAVFFNGTGGYSTYVYAHPDELVSIPAGLDSVKAVAVILNYVTAYQMLHRIARVSEGESILIHGASGGVGTALLELGKISGLHMYGTASLPKHPIVAQFGATPIDYRNEDFVSVLRQRAPEGMDAVFDPIGGPNWGRSLQTLSKKGRFVGYGYSSVLNGGDANDWINNWSKFANEKTTERGNPIHLYSVTALKKDRVDWFQEDLRHLFSMLADGKINPVIARQIPLQEAAKAHELLEKSASTGKIVLVC